MATNLMIGDVTKLLFGRPYLSHPYMKGTDRPAAPPEGSAEEEGTRDTHS